MRNIFLVDLNLLPQSDRIVPRLLLLLRAHPAGDELVLQLFPSVLSADHRIQLGFCHHVGMFLRAASHLLCLWPTVAGRGEWNEIFRTKRV